LICLVVFLSALANLLTKQVATISGLIFTAAFLSIFLVSERYNVKRRRGAKHEHLEQFNQQVSAEIDARRLRLEKPFRKLVAIRSPHNLHMLEKALVETDPDNTDVIVMTAKVVPPGGETGARNVDLDVYDQQLMTAVVERAERMGKKVVPLIVMTNNPLHAVLKAAKDLAVQELVMGASNKFTAEEQLDQIAFYWINLHDGRPRGLTVRILSRDRDVSNDLEGGNRIPKLGERRARSVAELRAAGVGVDRVLLAHDGTPADSDLFRSVLTMLDPDVKLDLAAVGPSVREPSSRDETLEHDRALAKGLGRELKVHSAAVEPGPTIVRMAREGQYDLVILSFAKVRETLLGGPDSHWMDYVRDHAHCPVFMATQPEIPREVED
jgi:nucleotide-binding universal stress UspA family protein